MKEIINGRVKKAYETVGAVAANPLLNDMVGFTNYVEVEKELKGLKPKIEENQIFEEIFLELRASVSFFSQMEYFKEVKYNANYRTRNDVFYQIDSSNQKSFYILMKKIITLKTLMNGKINPKYKVIVEELFEDFSALLNNAELVEKENLNDPISFYKKLERSFK